MKKRLIALVSDSRCSHSLYTTVLDAIKRNPLLDYHYIVTGMHLSKQFGETVKTIESEGYKVGSRINAGYGAESLKGEAKAVARWVAAFADEFSAIKPDIALLQGDRGVSLAAAIAGAYMNIPVAHMFGGEVSGTIDESVRHAITRLAHIHFPETRQSAERIIKMGEQPWRVHLAGSTGVEYALTRKMPGREAMQKKFGMDFSKPLILVLQHPVSFEAEESEKQFRETMKAIEQLRLQTIIIYPDDDAGSKSIVKVIKEYGKKRLGFQLKAYKNIPYPDYLGLLSCCYVLVGNSSGAIIEAPSLAVPVVNIGTRQINRERTANVIDAGYDSAEIKTAIEKALYDYAFLELVRKRGTPYNPFGTADAGNRIAKVLAEINLDEKLLMKQITF